MIWLAWILLVLVCFPLITLLHELGHALPALAFGAPDVKIVMGSSDRLARGVFRRRLGRLEVIVASWLVLSVGSVHATHSFTPRQQALVILGGPLVSLLLVVVLAPLAYASRSAPDLPRLLAQGTATLAFATLLLTAIPMRYPRWYVGYAGKPSDMLRLVQLRHIGHNH